MGDGPHTYMCGVYVLWPRLSGHAGATMCGQLHPGSTHTPQPLFHPLCTICTATTATKKQLHRKSQSDGQVFDLQVGRTLVLVRVHMSLFDNLLVICDFVAFKADCERWMP